MNAFPADHELVAFFEDDPRVLDPGVPWSYNTLDFRTERQGVLVECRMSPGYGDIAVRLSQVGGAELARVEVGAFHNVRLVMSANGEALIATSDRAAGELCLMLKPRVWVGFGRFKQMPPQP